MDNSLQEIAGSFTFLGMKNKLLSIFALALLPASMAVPQVAQASAYCVGNECEVNFYYTGHSQIFTPPSDASNLRVEIFGAGGGRGGAGGKVTGVFAEIPQAVFVYVGQAGAVGTLVPGGFNGGGASGGNSGTEGSGGGATDIRLGQGLETRILVAGGGGGGGGEAGGNGGHGGMEFAAHGGSGQASGGGGGSPTQGGFAGVSNGGFQAGSIGVFGQGGAGGLSTFAGGGGGGGGWYGGGGGGADDNTCCSDGGGGGGGSSYAKTNYFLEINHAEGVSWGDGWVTFRYPKVPAVSYFELIQVSNNRALFSLEATEDLVGLGIDDFVVDGSGCELVDLEVNSTTGYGVLENCNHGEVTLSILANSFGNSSLGPSSIVQATMAFDAQAPVFEFQSQPVITSQSEILIGYSVTDQVTLTLEHFQVLGCDAIRVTEGELLLSECTAGVGRVVLLPNRLTDLWQNTGPESPMSFSFVIDIESPQATWSSIAVAGSGPFSYSATLNFSEPVVLGEVTLALTSSADCESGHQILEDRILAWASCDYSALSWAISANVRDLAGNQMSLTELSTSLTHTRPQTAVVSQPVINEAPVVIPAPPSESAQTISEAVEPVTAAEATESPVLSEPRAEQPSSIANPIAGGSSMDSLANVVENALLPVQLEADSSVPEVTSAPLAEPLTQETQAPELVAGPALDLSDEQFPWLPIALVLGLGVLGFGAWRFSGR